MKRTSLVLLMAVCLFAVGCQQSKAPRVAVVNTDLVYKNSTPGQEGISYLENLSKELEAQIITLQKDGETARDKKAAQEKFQQELVVMQQRFAAEQQQVVTKLNSAYEEARAAVLAKHNIQLLLPSDVALNVSPEADVTDKVIEEMNAKAVTFEPLKPEELPAAQQ